MPEENFMPEEFNQNTGGQTPPQSQQQQMQQPQPQMPSQEPEVQTQSMEPPPNVHYAGFWIRFVASCIDGLVLLIPLMIIGGIIAFVFYGTFSFISPHVMDDSSFSSAIFGSFVDIITRVISFVLSAAYFTVMTGKYGATLGKMAVGVKVVDKNYQKPSYGTAAMREYLGKFIDGFTLGIGYIMAGFTDKKQALHDFIAKTYVVYKR